VLVTGIQDVGSMLRIRDVGHSALVDDTYASRPCDSYARATGAGRIAICVAGHQRLSSQLIFKIMLHVVEPIRASVKHVFVALPAGSEIGPALRWSPKNITVAEPLKDPVVSVTHQGYRTVTHEMAHTLRYCAVMIKASEVSSRLRYGWIMRLRGDQAYDFAWHPDSTAWYATCGSQPTLHTSNCWSGPHDWRATDCVGESSPLARFKELLPRWMVHRPAHHEALCMNDQFGVLSREAMRPYFGLLEQQFSRTNETAPDPSGKGDLFVTGWTRSPSPTENRGVHAGDPPECKLGAILSQHRVAKRMLQRLVLDRECEARSKARTRDRAKHTSESDLYALSRPDASCYHPRDMPLPSEGYKWLPALLDKSGNRRVEDTWSRPLENISQLDSWPEYMYRFSISSA